MQAKKASHGINSRKRQRKN